MVMKHSIKWSEEEFQEKYSKEWEQSVEIIHWEHDFENGWYIIKYKDKK